jgi:hypothetical protein
MQREEAHDPTRLHFIASSAGLACVHFGIEGLLRTRFQRFARNDCTPRCDWNFKMQL